MDWYTCVYQNVANMEHLFTYIYIIFSYVCFWLLYVYLLNLSSQGFLKHKFLGLNHYRVCTCIWATINVDFPGISTPRETAIQYADLLNKFNTRLSIAWFTVILKSQFRSRSRYKQSCCDIKFKVVQYWQHCCMFWNLCKVHHTYHLGDSFRKLSCLFVNLLIPI